MTPFSITNRHLPGVGSFLKRCPMFREIPTTARPGPTELAKVAIEDLRSGKYRAGDRFPTPGQLADLTGVPLADSLDAITILLKSGHIRQNSSGFLTVSPAGVDKSAVGAPAAGAI